MLWEHGKNWLKCVGNGLKFFFLSFLLFFFSAFVVVSWNETCYCYLFFELIKMQCFNLNTFTIFISSANSCFFWYYLFLTTLSSQSPELRPDFSSVLQMIESELSEHIETSAFDKRNNNLLSKTKATNGEKMNKTKTTNDDALKKQKYKILIWAKRKIESEKRNM